MQTDEQMGRHEVIVVFRNCFAYACTKGMDVWGVGFRVMIYTVLFCVIPISLLIGSSVSEEHTDFIIRAEVPSIQKMETVCCHNTQRHSIA